MNRGLGRFSGFSSSLDAVTNVFGGFPLGSLRRRVNNRRVSVKARRSLVRGKAFVRVGLVPRCCGRALMSVRGL